MKLLLIHQYYLKPGDAGISRFNQMVKYWRENGHDITVLAGSVHYMTGVPLDARRRQVFWRERGAHGETVVRCYVSERYNTNFTGRLWGYVSFLLSSIVALLKLERHDLVLGTSPPLFAGVTGYIAALLWRKPFVFEVRDLWPESAIELGVLTNKPLISLSYAVEKFLYARAATINVLTPAFTQALIEKKGIHPSKIVCIPNGADEDTLIPKRTAHEVRRTLGLEEKFIVTYIGAHGIANHLDQILDCAHELSEPFPNIIFLLIGSGMQKPHLQNRAQREGLKNIVFLDPQPKEDIADYIAASDVCCAVLKRIPIFTTVYPNKIFDYMLCKKPILVGIDGAARELVERAHAGIYFEPENIPAFRDAIIACMTNREMIHQWGENGYVFVKTHFSRTALAQQYEEILIRIARRAL